MKNKLQDYIGELISKASEPHFGWGAGAGSTDTSTYKCACGKGIVVHLKEDTPSFRESDWIINCADCLANFTYPTKESVHNRGCEAIGKTMGELATAMESKVSAKKSQVGYAWESWFGVVTNSEAGKDLTKAGVELKSTGVIDTRNGKSAKERLVLNIINYIEEYQMDFYRSSFWTKNNRMEIAFYAHDKTKIWMDFEILKSVLFEFPEKDLIIIEQDFDIIQSYINSGNAHKLSESLTMYLGACPKGTNKNSVRRQHPNLNAPRAIQRAYSLKNSYMTYLVRNYVFGELSDKNIRLAPFTVSEETVDSVESEAVSLVPDVQGYLESGCASFEAYILSKIQKWIGCTQIDMANRLGIVPDQNGLYPKHINAMLISRILGISDVEKAEEFQKAGIIVKTITVEASGGIREQMSFPAFRFKDLAQETWEESTLKDFFESAKFFLVVFKKDTEGRQIFQGVKFFSLPQHDIEGLVRGAWQETVDTINKGVVLENTQINPKKKPRIKNNFVNASDKRIIHVRPHASLASYILDSNSDELPVKAVWINKPRGYSDNYMTKQCFWLNNDYILSQIKDIL